MPEISLAYVYIGGKLCATTYIRSLGQLLEVFQACLESFLMMVVVANFNEKKYC